MDNRNHRQAGKITRRATLKALASGLVAWPVLSRATVEAFVAQRKAAAPPKLRFLAKPQYDAVDRIAETIIPADPRSGGAHAARVADYIDLLLSEASPDVQAAWTGGLAAFEQECIKRNGKGVVGVNAAQLDGVLAEVSRNESAPKSPAEEFFVVIKNTTIRAYYASEIGIHKELEYKGNQILTEFVGCTHPEHGYVPPRA